MKRKSLILVIISLLCVIAPLSISTNTSNAASIELKGHYLYDRQGRAYKIPLSKKGNHTNAAKKVAKLIAKCVGKKSGDTDLKRVDMAAYYVSLFARRDRYSMKARYYNKAYGVFIGGYYSCAGTADAMQMVLNAMGFKSKHVNKNAYTHQWCTLKMDGKQGYADGQAGFANYGKYFTKKIKFVSIPTNSTYAKKMMAQLR